MTAMMRRRNLMINASSSRQALAIPSSFQYQDLSTLQNSDRESSLESIRIPIFCLRSYPQNMTHA